MHKEKYEDFFSELDFIHTCCSWVGVKGFTSSTSQLEVKSLHIMNTNLLLLIQKSFKHLKTSIYGTSVPFASSVLFQTETLYFWARHSMDWLKGIISISLLGKKQLLRYQLHFSPLLTFPKRTKPTVCKFCLLFAVIFKSVILQNTIKAIFSSWMCIFTFIPLHLWSDAEFQAIMSNPSPASLSYQNKQDSSATCQFCCFILYPLHLLLLWSSWKTWTIHHITCPNIPHIIEKERPDSLLPSEDYTHANGNMAHTFKAAIQNKTAWTHAVLLIWDY